MNYQGLNISSLALWMLLSLVAFKGFNVPYEARADKIYMLLQRGDSVIAPNKHPNLRLWDGMVGYLDPREWQSKVVFSDYWLGEVCVVELPRSRKPMLIEANKSYESAILGPNGFPVTSDVTRRTRGYVDVQSLSPFVSTQIPDLMTRYYKHKTFMPVIDGGALPQSLLLDTKGVDFTKRPLRADVGQITIGNFTIGPVGADYIRYGGVGGAWTALGNLTGNLTFTLIGNILDNQGALAVINLGGFTLDNTSSNPHGGDPTAGWLITITAPATFFDMRQEGPGTFNMRNLRTVRPVGNFWDCVVQAIDNNHTINFHDLLVDHDGRGNGCIAINENTPDIYMYNCVMWDGSVLTGNFWLVPGGARATNIYENNCSYNALGPGFDVGNNGGIFRNNTAYDNGADFANVGASLGRYNISSDFTAANPNWGVGSAGNLVNRAAAVCVQGVNDALPNFMDILAAGPLGGAGEANAILARATCIRNRAVPGPTGTSIGPAEIPPIVPPPPPPPTPTGRQGGWSPNRQQYWRRMMAGKLSA